MRKNVIVTGATKGLGLSTVNHLVKEGYRVIGIARKNSKSLQNLIQKYGSTKIVFHQFDLQELKEIPSLIQQIISKHGPLYGLINNAAIGSDGLLATMHANDISNLLKINLEAPILMAKFSCRNMLLQGEGRIINISSIIADTGFNGLSVYGATKAGLVGFTKSLSRELGRSNITVNCLSPGFMKTDMTAILDSEKINSISRRAPLGLPTTSDAAAAVVYLMSTEANKITGTTITVDGGSTA